jgi:hypothetical protein
MAFKHLTQGPSHDTCDVGRYHERSISKDTVVPGILGHISFLSYETALNGALLASRGPILWVIFVFFWNIV